MKITNLYKNCAGPSGVQLDISFAGCEHHCKGCYVPELWDPTMFPDWSTEYIYNEISKLEKYVDGFVLLGGDPLYKPNIHDTILLESHLRDYNKPITLITGYTMDEINRDIGRKEAFMLADKVITGRYQENKRNIDDYIGSSNQQVYLNKRK